VYWHYVLVTLAPPAPCFLDVTVAAVDANATAAGNTKVKVRPRAAGLRPGDCCTGHTGLTLGLGILLSLTNRVFLCKAKAFGNAHGGGLSRIPDEDAQACLT